MNIQKPKTYLRVIRDCLKGRRPLIIGDIKVTGFTTDDCDLCFKPPIPPWERLTRIGIYSLRLSFDIYVCERCSTRVLSSKFVGEQPFFKTLRTGYL